jgi:hypothetical protein
MPSKTPSSLRACSISLKSSAPLLSLSMRLQNYCHKKLAVLIKGNHAFGLQERQSGQLPFSSQCCRNDCACSAPYRMSLIERLRYVSCMTVLGFQTSHVLHSSKYFAYLKTCAAFAAPPPPAMLTAVSGRLMLAIQEYLSWFGSALT